MSSSLHSFRRPGKDEVRSLDDIILRIIAITAVPGAELAASTCAPDGAPDCDGPAEEDSPDCSVLWTSVAACGIESVEPPAAAFFLLHLSKVICFFPGFMTARASLLGFLRAVQAFYDASEDLRLLARCVTTIVCG